MATQSQGMSPEVDELSCIPETQQSHQAGGIEVLVMAVEDLLEVSDTSCRGTEGQGQGQRQIKDQGRTRCNRREG